MKIKTFAINVPKRKDRYKHIVSVFCGYTLFDFQVVECCFISKWKCKFMVVFNPFFKRILITSFDKKSKISSISENVFVTVLFLSKQKEFGYSYDILYSN